MLNTIRRRFRLLFYITIVIVIAIYYFVQFATTEERHLYALDTATGKIVWSAPLDWSWSSYVEPVVDNRRVFIPTNDLFDQPRTQHWRLTAYDAGTGRMLWNYAPFGQAGVGELCDAMVNAPPIVADGQVYSYVCAATDPNDTDTIDKASVVALDEATGAVLWQYDDPSLEPFLNDGAALTLRELNGSVYILSMDKARQWGIDVLDAKHGTLTRHIDLPDLVNVDSPSLPVDGLQTDGQSLFFNVKGLTSLDPISGMANYTLQVRDVPWTAENGLYASSSDGTTLSLAGYDIKTGAMHWQRTLDKSLIPDAPADRLSFSFQIKADTHAVYIFALDDIKRLAWIMALNSADGSTLWIKHASLDPMLGDILAKVGVTPNLVVFNENGDVEGIQALLAADGAPRWFFPANTKAAAPTIDGLHVYLFDESKRFRNWLALINPTWHGE